MDAIALLKQDHRMLEELFQRFEAASDRATKMKRKIVDQVIRLLSIHAAIEEQLFYPAAREALSEAEEEMVLEALEEHHLVKWTLYELESMPAENERFDAKVSVLMANVRQHLKEEERELFPAVRKVMSVTELRELGEQLEQAKKSAPTHPHPRAPDEPPGVQVAGTVAAAMDRGRDMLKTLAGRAKLARTKSATPRALQ
jgi:hemerythrin superfamily protein